VSNIETDPRPPPPDNTIRLVFSGVCRSMPWANVMWLSVTANTYTAADLSSILTSIGDQWRQDFCPSQASDTTLTQIMGIWKTPGAGEIVQSYTQPQAGTAVGASLNNVATAAVINWRIDRYYRGGRPRTYIAGVPDTACTDGVHLAQSYLTTLQAGAGAFRQALDALTVGGITNVKLGTVSFVSQKAWRIPPVFFAFNGSAVRSVLGTQRKRLLA